MISQTPGVEADPAFLTPADTPWLEELRGKPVNQEWLDEANLLIPLGSISLAGLGDSQEASSALLARENFFGSSKFLGFDMPGNLAHHAHASRRRRKPTLAPLDTFVQAQRVLYRNGLSGLQTIRANSNAIGRSAESFQTLIDDLQANGFDKTLVSTNSHLLSLEAERRRLRLGDIGRTADWLEWPGRNELVRSSYSSLSIPKPHLRLTARLLFDLAKREPAKHSAVGRLNTLLATSPDSQILTFVFGEQYSATGVKNIENVFSDEETRRELVSGILNAAPDSEQERGRRILEYSVGPKSMREIVRYNEFVEQQVPDTKG